MLKFTPSYQFTIYSKLLSDAFSGSVDSFYPDIFSEIYHVVSSAKVTLN